MNASEPKNDLERLARMKDARAQDEAALNARRADHKSVPRKAGEPGDYYRGQVTPEDMAAIKRRHFETAEARHKANLVGRIAEAQERQANPHGLAGKRPFAGVAQTLQNRWPR